MTLPTFKEFLNESDRKYDFNHLELQSQINSLSARKQMILRDDYGFGTIPSIDNMEDSELQRLHDVLSVYFFITLPEVLAELDTLDDEEIDELGVYLTTTFLDYEYPEGIEDGEEEEPFDREELTRIVKLLCKEYQFIGFLKGIIHDGVPEAQERLEESPARVMKAKSMNKKKRKFMTKSASQLRRETSSRKRDANKNRAKKKRYYKANKTKIASYQKSRTNAIKKGKHQTKKRRTA